MLGMKKSKKMPSKAGGALMPRDSTRRQGKTRFYSKPNTRHLQFDLKRR